MTLKEKAGEPKFPGLIRLKLSMRLTLLEPLRCVDGATA